MARSFRLFFSPWLAAGDDPRSAYPEVAAAYSLKSKQFLFGTPSQSRLGGTLIRH